MPVTRSQTKERREAANAMLADFRAKIAEAKAKRAAEIQAIINANTQNSAESNVNNQSKQNVDFECNKRIQNQTKMPVTRSQTRAKREFI